MFLLFTKSLYEGYGVKSYNRTINLVRDSDTLSVLLQTLCVTRHFVTRTVHTLSVRTLCLWYRYRPGTLGPCSFGRGRQCFCSR